jgi:transcriptional regulator with XRE-family HTH domain
MKNIGIRIKEKRKENSLSQKDLAEKVGIDNSQFSKIESGKLLPTISQLVEICSILNESMDWIVLGKKSSPDQMDIVDMQTKHIEIQEKYIKSLERELEVLKNNLRFNEALEKEIEILKKEKTSTSSTAMARPAKELKNK